MGLSFMTDFSVSSDFVGQGRFWFWGWSMQYCQNVWNPQGGNYELTLCMKQGVHTFLMCVWVFWGIFTVQCGGGCVLWRGVGGSLFLLLFLNFFFNFFLMLCCVVFCFILFVVKLCFRLGIVSLPQNKFCVSFQKCCFGITNCGKFESGCWNTQTLCKPPIAGRSCLVPPKALLAWLHFVHDELESIFSSDTVGTVWLQIW